MMVRTPRTQHLAEWLLLFLVAAAILWRGGKSIDATWAVGMGTLLILALPSLGRLLWNKKRGTDDSQLHVLTVPLPLWGVLLFYIAWSCFSYIVSETRTYGLDELVRDASCVLLFLWIVRHSGSEHGNDLAHRFFWVVSIAGAVAVLFGLAVYVLQPVNRFTGSFLDWRFHTDYWPNAWAEFVLLAWPIALLLTSRLSTIPRRLVGVLIVGSLVGSLFLSYSRGGLIAFCGQVTVLAVLWAALALRDVRVAKITAMQWHHIVAKLSVAIVVAIVFFFAGNALRAQRYSVQSVSDKLTFTAAEGTSSIDERAEFWHQAVTLSLERPLFGYGPYSFRFTQPHLMTSVLATSDHPHNVFLKLAAERGFPTAIAFLLFLLYIVGLSLKHLFFDRKNDWSIQNDTRTIALLVAVLGVLAHNLIDYNLQFVGVALPLWVALAFLSTNLAGKRPVSRASFRNWRLSRGLRRIESVVVLLLVATIAWEGTFLVLSSLARRAEARGAIDQAILWYERSSLEWFSRDRALAFAVLLQHEQRADDAEAVLRESLEENAVDARAWRMRSDSALLRGEKDLAVQYAEHAYSLGRYTDIAILRVLLDALRAHGDTATLRVRRDEFEALFERYATAIQQNTHFIALGSAVEELERVGQRLRMLYPEHAARYDELVSQAIEHAAVERATYAARPPGLLW